MIKTLCSIFTCGLLVATTAYGQAIQWTEFESLEDSLRNQRKPVLIFIHTDWCKYCELQKNTTFKDAALTHDLNKKYYCLQLNAESKSAITFLGRKYTFKSSRGYHELAEMLGTKNEELLFPTTVLLSKNLEVSIVLQGLQQASDLHQVIF